MAFDEFAGRDKTANRALVIMKNMANKTFSRGVQTMGAEASFSFVGNTDHNVSCTKEYDLFEAFRRNFTTQPSSTGSYLPTWLGSGCHSWRNVHKWYGFIVDYLASTVTYAQMTYRTAIKHFFAFRKYFYS